MKNAWELIGKRDQTCMKKIGHMQTVNPAPIFSTECCRSLMICRSWEVLLLHEVTFPQLTQSNMNIAPCCWLPYMSIPFAGTSCALVLLSSQVMATAKPTVHVAWHLLCCCRATALQGQMWTVFVLYLMLLCGRKNMKRIYNIYDKYCYICLTFLNHYSANFGCGSVFLEVKVAWGLKLLHSDWEFMAGQRHRMTYLSSELCVSEASAHRVWPGGKCERVFTLLMTNGVKVTR